MAANTLISSYCVKLIAFNGHPHKSELCQDYLQIKHLNFGTIMLE